jgi:putative ABC transport system permease protein
MITIQLRLQTIELEIVGEIDEGAFFFQPTVYILRPTLLDLKYGELPSNERPAASIVLVQGDVPLGIRDGFELVNKQTAFDNIEGVEGQAATVTSLQAFGYLIGALVIGVFFYVLTLQKIGQVAVLKAIGASNGYILRQLLIQVLVIAVVGLAIAIVLTLATDSVLQGDAAVVPIAFTTSAFVITGVALLATSVVGAVFSGRQVLRTDPIIALGQQQ